MKNQLNRGVCFAVVSTFVLASGTIAPGQASAQNNTQRGATFGGITGAIAGAIIGENNNEAGAGAAIGGALGAVAGGILGNANDRDARLRAQHQQYYYQPRAAQTTPTYAVTPAPVPTGAVSFNDVVAMSRSGVGENVIMNQIQSRGVQRQPVVSDIISLHQQGVSELVITAMQRAPVGNQLVSQGPAFVEAPVIVQQPRVYVQPAPVYRARPVYRAPRGYHVHYGR